MTHICVIKLTSIGSDNGLSSGRRQAIMWANARILLIAPLGINFNEILIQNLYILIQENAFENLVCEMSAILSGSNVFMPHVFVGPLSMYMVVLWWLFYCLAMVVCF